MISSVALGGHVCDWTFAGSALFRNWLASCPWRAQGGICSLRLPGPQALASITEPLRHAVFSADGGYSPRLRFVILESSEPDRTLRGDIASALGLSVEQQARELRESMCDALSHSTYVFVVLPRDGRHAVRAWDEARVLVDEMSKNPLRPAVTLVFIGLPGQPVVGDPTFDFTIGSPIDAVLGHADESAASLWASYAHARTAWECGGNLERASARSGQPPPVGDDEALEVSFNQQADRDAADLSGELRSGLQRHLIAVLRRDDEPTLEAALVDAGLLWRPPGTRTLRIAPWVARHILENDTPAGARWYLRGCLVCEPLVGEILATCLDLEVRVRALIGSIVQGTLPRAPEIAERAYERFVNGGYPGVYYPRSHPARPERDEDRWAFAPFRDFLNGLDYWRSREASSRLNRLAQLRNALAHGHYVCWPHVKEVVALIREIESLSGRDLASRQRLAGDR